MKKKVNIIIIGLMLIMIMMSQKVIATRIEANVEIDSPLVEQVAKDTLNFKGWVLSEDKNSKLEIYLDGEKQDVSIEREEREDVFEYYKDAYGGRSTNKLPGYRGHIDITGLKNGIHKFMIVVKSGASEELIRKENIFRVRDYNGKVEIDSPLSGAQVKTQLNFDGWEMTEDIDSELEVYLDGKRIDSKIERYERSDVIDYYKDAYGGRSTNLYPGYRGVIDTSQLREGEHEFTIKSLSKSKKEIATKTNTFNVKKYDSKIEIDNPYIGQVAQGKLYFKGWVLSDSLDNQVDVYLDGEKVDSKIERVSRKDVLDYYKGAYGGSSVNTLPGYTGEIDITKLKNGTHRFTVVAKTALGEELTRKENTFEVKNYEGIVEIDNPLNGMNKKNLISYKGWVLSEDINSIIEIYIDDVLMDTNITREARSDVIDYYKDAYGGSRTNAHPGYKGVVDAKSFRDGQHKFTVKVLSNSGVTIAEKTTSFQLKKYESKLEIDTPYNTNYDKKDIELKGWVLSEDSNNQIEVYIDNKKIDVELIRESREDVLDYYKDAYGGRSKNKNPGYRAKIDYKSLTEGHHEIKVKILASETGEVLVESKRSFSVNKYHTKIEIDSPLPQEKKKTTIDVKGWVMSEDKNGEIVIYLDGNRIDQAIEREERSDVIDIIKDYGDLSTNPTPGYRLTIDSSNLPDGYHTLKVEYISSESKEVKASLTNTFQIEKYSGMLCIDSPVLSNFNSAVELVGWELSELEGSYIKTSIDNYFVDANFKRVERQDVLDYYKGSFGGFEKNPLPGFEGKINLENTPEGKHTIKVYLYTKLNELIATYSKDIYVYKNEYFGIDVSQHNGSINNWNTIKKNGIDYVIVRSAVRGYAKEGNLREDTLFHLNVSGAHRAGLKVGTYVFSQATNETEAVEEANLAIKMANLAGGKSTITLPIIFDSEFSGCEGRCGRADKLTRDERTTVAKAFLDTVRNAGYMPMIYASSTFLEYQLDMSRLQNVDVWVAHYDTSSPSYKGMYQMWQYSSKGSVPGISGYVDLNKIYKKY